MNIHRINLRNRPCATLCSNDLFLGIVVFFLESYQPKVIEIKKISYGFVQLLNLCFDPKLI